MSRAMRRHHERRRKAKVRERLEWLDRPWYSRGHRTFDQLVSIRAESNLGDGTTWHGIIDRHDVARNLENLDKQDAAIHREEIAEAIDNNARGML